MHSAGRYMVLHVDLFVRSMTRSLKFYCDGMGFSLVDDALLSGALVRSISNGSYDELRLVLMRSSPLGAMIELVEFQRDSALHADALSSALPTGAVSILVPDLDTHMSRAASSGWRPISEVFAVNLPLRGDCRLVFYEDPDSNRLEFIQSRPRSAG